MTFVASGRSGVGPVEVTLRSSLLIRMGGMMIVLIETRLSVAEAYLDGLERLGVAGLLLEPAAFANWVGALGPQEFAAVEAVVAGDFVGRETISRKTAKLGGVPLVALLDKRSLEETLLLFSAGFDDVIGKPVHVREILARIHRISGRRKSIPRDDTLSDLQVFCDGRDPIVSGETLCLPRRERRILECLDQTEGAWITKTQLFNRVYGVFNDQYDESVIESHICRLRRRLKMALGYDPVESQRYLGYRLKLKSGDLPAPRGASPTQTRFDSIAEAVG